MRPILRAILSSPHLYRLFQKIVWGNYSRGEFSKKHIQSKSGGFVLDIGCGTADIVRHLPGVHYVGFDMNSKYIRFAKKKYASRGNFLCGNVLSADFKPASFDIVLAVGILHHLSDEDAHKLILLAESVLKKGGRFITMDGCYDPGQSPIARVLIFMDRGKFMRNEEGYKKLASQVFSDFKTTLYHRMLRVPYTLAIMEMKK